MNDSHTDSLWIIPVLFPKDIDAAFVLGILFDLNPEGNVRLFIGKNIVQ